MMIALPKWYGKLEEKIKRLVKETAIENDIDLTLTEDSIAIDDCIKGICSRLFYLSDYEHPLHPKQATMKKEMEKRRD